MKSILQKIVFWISVSIFMAMVIAFLIWMYVPGQELIKILICFTPFPLFIIIGFIVTKHDDKKKKSYKSQYISEIIIQDKTFGKIKFEKDSKQNRLVCENFSKPFGVYYPTLSIEEYDETMNDFYCRNLECLYDRQEEILQTFWQVVSEQANSSGKATDITVKEELKVDISIQKCGEYFLAEEFELPVENNVFFEAQPEDWVICVSLLLYQPWEPTPTAYMDCRTKAICYVESN